MNATLESELSKLTTDQKLELIDRLWADLEIHGRPPGILEAEDPNLEAELEKRLRDARAHPETWMSLEQFKGSFGDR